VKVGDEIEVMVTEIDRMGRVNLSRRAILEGLSPEEAAASSAAKSERGGDRNGGGGDRGGDRGPRREYNRR
jgi:polyribonucleotide nucleotidyltransferase